MLEMSKHVLQKVSFDKMLFRKELTKARNWLKKEEITLLKAWALITFAGQYDDLIHDVLGAVS